MGRAGSKQVCVAAAMQCGWVQGNDACQQGFGLAGRLQCWLHCAVTMCASNALDVITCTRNTTRGQCLCINLHASHRAQCYFVVAYALYIIVLQLYLGF